MGMFSFIFKGRNNKELESSKKEVLNELLLDHYDDGTNVKDYSEEILAKYKSKTHEDVEQEILKKYLNNVKQEQIEEMAFENEQVIKNEIDEQVKGADKQTKEQIKKQVIEDKAKGRLEKNQTVKDKVVEVAYSNLYKDYSNRLGQIRNNQFYEGRFSMDSRETMQILGMERSLNALNKNYMRITGKSITKVPKIDKQRKELADKVNYTQRGKESITNERLMHIQMLYAIREEKHEKYIEALVEKRPPAEIAMRKQEYQDANLDLIQDSHSIDEYLEDMQLSQKKEDFARESGVKDSQVAKSEMSRSNKELMKDDISKSDISEDIDDTARKAEIKSEITDDYSEKVKQEALEKGDTYTAHEINDAENVKNETDKNIANDQKSKADLKEDINKEERINDNSFRSKLQGQVNEMNNTSSDKLKEVARDEVARQEKETQKIEKENEYVRQLKYTKKN